jgi:hypothetical protein
VCLWGRADSLGSRVVRFCNMLQCYYKLLRRIQNAFTSSSPASVFIYNWSAASSCSCGSTINTDPHSLPNAWQNLTYTIPYPSAITLIGIRRGTNNTAQPG